MPIVRKPKTELVIDGWIWKFSPFYSVFVIEGSAGDKGWLVHANTEVEARQKTERLRQDGFKPTSDYLAMSG
jgi:hypothetical protein